MNFTATYSPDDNKIRLYASSRLPPELYARVRAAGFIWAPKQDLFVAPMWTPGRADLAEELAGEIGDEDKSLCERAEERAERFDEYSDKRKSDAESAHASVARIADGIPMGQPILIGHHSERHARKDAEKIENGMRKAVKMWETSQYWTRRAQGALGHAKYMERPDVRARRIKTIEAARRKYAKEKAESEMWLKAWTAPALTLESARKIANYCNLTVTRTNADGTPNTNGGWSAYNVLEDDAERFKACPAKTVAECVTAANRAYPRHIAHCDRWLEHYDNRLAYERAMLGETGYITAPKNPTRAALPILNYGGEVQYKNRFGRGDIITAQAHAMTRAELAKIGTDYKATFISADGTHRIRCAIVGREMHRGLTVVYLTDSKIHAKPGGEITTKAQQKTAARVEKGQRVLDAQVDAARKIRAHNKAVIAAADGPIAPRPDDKMPAEAEAMRASLKAGVQVVSAPQLFPTPRELAQRVADLAEIEPGHFVLEPSAGTGALLGAMGGRMFGHNPERGTVVACEINQALAQRLEKEFPLTRVHCADFLEWRALAPEYPSSRLSFDRIVMNPPFINGVDIKHIQHARSMLKPGGRLVAICANGPRQREQLMPLADMWEDLPAGTFADQGTNVNTALLVITA